MNNSPLISLDIDGVLACFTDAFAQIANWLLDKALPPGYEPSDWDWTAVLSKRENSLIWRVINHTENFWISLGPYDDQVAAVRKYQEEYPENKIVFITARVVAGSVDPKIQSEVWLRNQGLTGTVYCATPGNKKAELIEQLGIAYSLDDYPETIRICNEVKGHKAYLLDRPWNRWAYTLPRVYSMTEFLQKTLASVPAEAR